MKIIRTCSLHGPLTLEQCYITRRGDKQCVECTKTSVARWKKRNPERYAAYCAAWHKSNALRTKLRRKEREQDPEVKERVRKYQREYHRKWRSKRKIEQ